MPQRSRHATLTARVEHIKQLVDDLARMQGGDSLTSRAMADRIKRDVESLRRALTRQQP
jgi:hypothetical protein